MAIDELLPLWLGWVRPHAQRQCVPSIQLAGLQKRALRQFEEEIMVAKSLKGKLQVIEMFRKQLTVNQDIVKEDDDEFMQVRTENRVHCGLE